MKGTNHKALKALAAKHDAKFPSILRNLKRATHKNTGFSWKVTEGKGNSIKIYNVEKGKVVKASSAKAAKPEKKSKKAAKPEKAKKSSKPSESSAKVKKATKPAKAAKKTAKKKKK